MKSQRELFDIPDAITYLNAAYMGPMSRPVVDAGVHGMSAKLHPWEITPADFFDPVEEVRGLFARVIDADADGVALLPAVSYGVAVAAQNLHLSSGDRIVLMAEEFPSNVYAWLEIAKRKGAEVITVPRPTDGDWTTPMLGVIDERVAIVAVSHCHWTDGGLLDLVRVGAKTRDVGAALVVDGTQSIGALPFDVEAVRPAFVITAVYKWLLGPYGAAFLWCAPEYREGVPLEYSWITRESADDFAHLVSYKAAYRPGARRYDVGQTSNFALIPALKAALEQTLGWGVENIAAYIRTLTDKVAAAADALGLGVAPQDLRSGHLLGVRLQGADPEVVAKAMAEADVFVSVRGDAMRVAPHVYNLPEEIDRLFEVLAATL